ncbi:MAG: hypothetical protein ACKVQR_04515 [Aquabacterium sp.]
MINASSDAVLLLLVPVLLVILLLCLGAWVALDWRDARRRRRSPGWWP